MKTYENGQYTEKIHNMNADQIWSAWKRQKLNMGQVAEWQQRHNYYFNISDADHAPKHDYNVYIATETEKYNFINMARKIGATISDVSGCGTGYYIQINATDHQVEKINKFLQET